MDNPIATVRTAYQDWQADRNANSAYEQGVEEFREDRRIMDYEMDEGILPGMEVTGEVDEVTADVENGVIYIPESERGAVTPEEMETAVEEYILGVFEQAGQPIVDGVADRYSNVIDGVDVDFSFRGEGDADARVSKYKVDQLPHGDTGMHPELEREVSHQAVQAVQKASDTPFDEFLKQHNNGLWMKKWDSDHPVERAYAFAAPNFEQGRQGYLKQVVDTYQEGVEAAEAGLDELREFTNEHWKFDKEFSGPLHSMPMNPRLLGQTAAFTLNQALSEEYGQEAADHLTREWAIEGTISEDAPQEFQHGPFDSADDMPVDEDLVQAMEAAYEWRGQEAPDFDRDILEKGRGWS